MEESRARVLVVDDEENQRRGLLSLIGGWGYEVRQAENGARALEVLEGWPAQLIVTDMMMPVMDGPATVQALRQINPLVKLIGASGISQNGQVARAAGAGLDHFLPKPYTADIMLRLIDTVLKS